jgi:hypothetical protein
LNAGNLVQAANHYQVKPIDVVLTLPEAGLAGSGGSGKGAGFGHAVDDSRDKQLATGVPAENLGRRSVPPANW